MMLDFATLNARKDSPELDPFAGKTALRDGKTLEPIALRNPMEEVLDSLPRRNVRNTFPNTTKESCRLILSPVSITPLIPHLLITLQIIPMLPILPILPTKPTKPFPSSLSTIPPAKLGVLFGTQTVLPDTKPQDAVFATKSAKQI